MLAGMEGLGQHGGNRKSSRTLQLDDLDITKTQSSRWQLAASFPEAEFEKHLGGARIRTPNYSNLLPSTHNRRPQAERQDEARSVLTAARSAVSTTRNALKRIGR